MPALARIGVSMPTLRALHHDRTDRIRPRAQPAVTAGAGSAIPVDDGRVGPQGGSIAGSRSPWCGHTAGEAQWHRKRNAVIAALFAGYPASPQLSPPAGGDFLPVSGCNAAATTRG